MSDRETNPPSAEELRDRLVDRGLRELLGGEAPRDLSERILAAAGGQGAMATQVVGGEAMDGRGVKGGRAKSRWGWAQFAVAATMLVAVGVGVLAVQRDRLTLSQRSTGLTVVEKSGDDLGSESRRGGQVFSSRPSDAADSVDPRQRERERAVEMEAAIVAAKRSGKELNQLGDRAGSGHTANSMGLYGLINDANSSTPAAGNAVAVVAGAQGGEGQAATAPGLVEQGATRGEHEFYFGEAAPRADRYAAGVEFQGGPQLPATQAPVVGDVLGRPIRLYAAAGEEAQVARESKSLMMAVTPHILIQEEEEVRLGHPFHAYRDNYARIVENPFKAVSAANTDNRLSTFSIDVDTASYANVRQFLMQSRTLPPADAVRIEELVNYFDYDYSAPTGDVPFDANVEVAACPWAPEHRLARIGIKGREMERSKRPPSNLVFLIDVSGSMDEPNKLPLLVEGMKLLTRELGENDRVAIVVYASSEGLALESTPGTEQSTILAALDQLAAGGSTAGGAGIQLAYQIAADHFIKGGTNRVILCTDGDFNVGVTSPAELERMAEAKAKETDVFLTVLGFGRGNLNDAMMEQIADKGNGNYHYVDTRKEARKVLVEEMAGTLVTIAKDVKIQVEFNPAKVAGYRLIGYENRVLAAEDFNDDKKDAGEIGAGHTVTALYEIVPAGMKVAAGGVDELKYAAPGSAKPQAAEVEEESVYGDGEASDELLTLKIRYKAPDGDTSKKLEFPIADNGQSFAKASEDFKFASSVASFGMLLRGSEFKGNATYAAVAEIAEAASGRDPQGYRGEFVEMVGRARELSGE